MANGTTIDRLGIEFVSRLAPDFGRNAEEAIKQFSEKTKPVIKSISDQFKNLSVNITTFFNLLKEVPVTNLARMIDTSGIVDKGVGAFKDMRQKSLAEFEKMSSGISGEVTKLKNEFAQLQKWIDQLKQGENPIVAWGPTAFAKGKAYFPESKRAVDTQTMALAPEEAIRAETQRVITEYAQRQLEVYKQMEVLIGRMGAFEQARIATSELIAQQVQQEASARARVAEFVQVTQTLLQRGMLAEGVDEKRLRDMKQYLTELIGTEEGRKVLNQELDNILKSIVKDEEQIKNIVMESAGIRKEDILTEEKILALAEQIKTQYAQARATIGTGGGIGGPGGGDEWNRLIGTITQAGDEVTKFQQKIQQIQLKAFIKPDEFERVTSLSQAINSQIDQLIKKLAIIGDQPVAAGLAKDFNEAEAAVNALLEKLKIGPVQNLNTEIQTLVAQLQKLAITGKEFQLQGVRTGLEAVNKEINQLSGGVIINASSIKKLGLGTLELGKLQELLAEKMKLTRQEFQLTGVATTEMNARMKATNESLVMIGHEQASFARRTGDALRAMDRWGAGFKDMLKSQMAWMIGGAILFGTIFKIKSAISETIDTMFKFSQAIIDVGAITNASAGDMKILEKAARDVATSTKMGFIEAAEALKILGQAGLTAKESAEALKTVAMLVTATGASSLEAVKVLTTAMNVWKLSAQESTRIGNVLAAALNYSKLEINDLATAFNYVAATSKQVGMSIESTAATLALLSNAGLRASTIGTGLRGILGQLIAPSANFEKELKAIEVDFEDIRMPGHNLIEILGLLEKKGFDLTAIFEGLEKRQAGVFASLRDMGPAALQRMTDALTGTNAMLVMNERAMQGPMNQLHIFKTRLLDTALSISDIVIPSFNLFIKGLGTLVETFKMLWPIFIGGAVIIGIKALINHFDLLTTATTRLGLALIWLKANLIVAGLSIIAIGVTAVKLAYDALHKSNEDYIKQIDREIMLYVQQVGELEALRIKLKTVKMSQDEIREAVNNLSGEYTDLKNVVNQVGMSHTEFKTRVIAEIDEIYKKIQDLKFERLALMIEDLEKLNKKVGDLKARIGMAEVGIGEALIPGVEKTVELNRGLREELIKTNEKILGMRKGIDDVGRSFKGMGDEARTAEEVLWDVLTGKGWKPENIKLAVAGLRKALQEGLDADAKAIEDNMKARLTSMRTTLFEMRKELADEEGKIRLAYEEGMKKFPVKGYADTEEGIKAAKIAAEGRAAVQATYDRKMQEFRAKELKREQDIEFQIRSRGLADQLSLSKKELDDRVKIQKVMNAELLQEFLQFEKEMADIRYREEMREIKPSEADRLRRQATDSYYKAKVSKEEEAALAIQKLWQKEARDEEKERTDFDNRMRRLRHETAQSLIAIAKTEQKDVEAQREIFRVEELDEEDKHSKEVLDIHKNHLNEDKELTQRGVQLVYQEYERHTNKVIELKERENKAVKDTQEKWEKERIKEIEKGLKLEIEKNIRADQDILKAKEAQYDAMSEGQRQTDTGKKLKYEIDQLTASIAEKTIAQYEDTIATELNTKGADANMESIAKWREEIDRLSERLRKSRRDAGDWEKDQQGLLAGLASGWKNFWDSTDSLFKAGQQFFIDFTETGKRLFSDFFTVLLSRTGSFRDAFRSFTNSLTRVWSDMLAKMVMDWVKTMSMKGIWGFISSLFGGSIPQIELTPGSTGVGPPMPVHGGGPIVKRHEGGFGLERDEVIAKLLTNEYVLRREASQGIGRQNLDYMNQTGKLPQSKEKIPIEIQIFNILDPADVVARGVASDPNVIVNPVVSSYSRNMEMRKTIMVDR